MILYKYSLHRIISNLDIMYNKYYLHLLMDYKMLHIIHSYCINIMNFNMIICIILNYYYLYNILHNHLHYLYNIIFHQYFQQSLKDKNLHIFNHQHN